MIRHIECQTVSPSRVVVIGASGFVGRDLVQHLEGNVEVLPLASADIDLTKAESVERLRSTVGEKDSVVIVSAITPDKGKDVATLMRNLVMGQHLSSWLEASRCAHVVYISSDAVYGDDANPVRETSCCDPSSFHGLMHLVRERLFADAAQKAGSPYVILRPSAIYGANDTHNSYGPNRFMRTATTAREIKLFGQGEEKRDHIYVKDLSRIAGLCLARRSEGILNVATGHSISFFELTQTIGRLIGTDVRIKGSPRANPVTHRHFDIAAIHKAFPDFELTSLEKGLAESLEGMPRAAAG